MLVPNPLPSPSPARSSGDAVAVDSRALGASEGDAPWHPSVVGLSNDYLNHYSEVLMLIEMSASDAEMACDLARWRPMDYRAYFRASPLRRAESALRAYDALPSAHRETFEALTATMDGLARTAILALQPPCEPGEAALIADVILPPFRRLFARAASFLNSGGLDLKREGEVEAQAVIDRLIERAGAAG